MSEPAAPKRVRPTKPMIHTQRLLRPRHAADKLGTSVGSIWRFVRDNPEFPRPVKLSDRITVFNEAELDAFIAARKAAATEAPQVGRYAKAVAAEPAKA